MRCRVSRHFSTQFLIQLALQFCCDTSCGYLSCSHAFFCWQQVLTLILIGLFCLVPLSYTAFFFWQQVLVSSFDWFIFFSMALVTGPDERRWPEYETLLRATPPKLNMSCNVFGGEQTHISKWFGFISNRPRSIYLKNANMTPRLKSQNCKFLTTPLSRNSQKRLEHKENQNEYRKMTRRSGSHVRILKHVYRTWAVARESRLILQPSRRIAKMQNRGKCNITCSSRLKIALSIVA